jgi:hypothetical protein
MDSGSLFLSGVSVKVILQDVEKVVREAVGAVLLRTPQTYVRTNVISIAG